MSDLVSALRIIYSENGPSECGEAAERTVQRIGTEWRMANNRMWLVNKRTDARVLLAKYYPSTGWYVFHDDLGKKMDQLFEDNEPPTAEWGDNDWTIEYEQQAESEAPTPPTP